MCILSFQCSYEELPFYYIVFLSWCTLIQQGLKGTRKKEGINLKNFDQLQDNEIHLQSYKFIIISDVAHFKLHHINFKQTD